MQEKKPVQLVMQEKMERTFREELVKPSTESRESANASGLPKVLTSGFAYI
jgi:hypothetical protein